MSAEGADATAAPTRFINRELSRLDFVERILALAADPVQPLLERVKFLAIASQNLDEFFQVRIASLQQQVLAGIGGASPDGLSPLAQLAAVRSRAVPLADELSALFHKLLVPELAKHRIVLCDASTLDEADRRWLSEFYEHHVFPVLTPLAIDPAHPFPYISSLSLNLAVRVRDPESGDPQVARVKVPPALPRFVFLPDGERFVPLEQIIEAHLDRLFPGLELIGCHPFRVTRSADLELEEAEAEDLLIAIEAVVRRRHRFAPESRLEVGDGMPDDLLRLLCSELELADEDVYVVDGLLDLSRLWQLHRLDRPELRDAPWSPVTQPRLRGATDDPPDIFQVIRSGDLLVQHPYDNFLTSVVEFIEQASRDPAVLAIKQTLYRTSGPGNPIVSALTDAAERGKEVVAVVELKARFEEQANISWARTLEESGVHVVYGLVGLKTHAKAALVLRREGQGIRRYAHVATGNYNPQTAAVYEDVGLFTTNPDVCEDIGDLFNVLTGYSRQRKYRHLLVAPPTLRTSLLDKIATEAAAPDGRIVMKLNNLVDPETIDALYAASRAGCEIDLIVRSICCLRPGVPNLSDRIRVRSIVGPFLEHSRIYRFGPRDNSRGVYIGSADLMQRNLDRRVEVVTPVDDPHLAARLDAVLDASLADDALSWQLQPDGAWSKMSSSRGFSVQAHLRALAVASGRMDDAGA